MAINVLGSVFVDEVKVLREETFSDRVDAEEECGLESVEHILKN